MILTKFLTGFLTILIALLLFTVPALAETERIYLEELYMNMDIPDDGYIITRDIAEDDPALSYLDMTQEEMLYYLEGGDIYLEYVSIDPYFEIDITKYEDEYPKRYFNLNLFSDEQLNNLAKQNLENMDKEIQNVMEEREEYAELIGKVKIQFIRYELASIGEIKYIIFDGSLEIDRDEIYARQYQTLYNGQGIGIGLHSDDTPLTNDMTDKLKTIVDSIEFTTTLEPPEDITYYQDLLEPHPMRIGMIDVFIFLLLGYVVFRLVRRIKRRWSKKYDKETDQSQKQIQGEEKIAQVEEKPTQDDTNSFSDDD